MLITDLPYRQKYLSTCVEAVNYILDFSGIKEPLTIVPSLIDISDSDWYFPEIHVLKSNKHLIWASFSYRRRIEDVHEMIVVLLPELRSIVKTLMSTHQDMNVPTTKEVVNKIEEIYHKFWDK
jgi:hypothetical protein